MIRSFPPHPNPLPPRERVGHSSPQQSWGVFWHILNNSETSLEEVVCSLDLILEDGHISEDEFEEYLKEAERLGAQLIGFGKKVRSEGTRL